jgi:hypothetical protein
LSDFNRKKSQDGLRRKLLRSLTLKDFNRNNEYDPVSDLDGIKKILEKKSPREVFDILFPNIPDSNEKETKGNYLNIKQSQSTIKEAPYKKPIYTSFTRLPDQTIIEEIYDPQNKDQPFQFVIKKGDTGEITYDGEYKFEGTLYQPIQSDIVKKKALSLPSGLEDYKSEDVLLYNIQRHIHRYVELDKSFERITAYYVLLTYCYDCFSELPYLRVKADYGTGKSRFLLTVGPLCYKPLIAGGAVTASPIFRFIDEWGGTLIIDEADFKSSEMYDEIIKILNCRFNRGIPVLRSEQRGKTWVTMPYNVYGPTLLATRRDFKDKALESRCVTYNMEPRTRDDIPINLDEEELFKSALNLRNQLLQWRLNKIRKVTLKPDRKIEGIEDRLNQIVVPLLSIVEDESVRSDLRDFMKSYNQNLIEDRGLTLEFQALHAITKIINEGKPSFNESKRRKHDLFSFKAITELINRDRDDRDKISPQKVGYLLKNLDLKKDRFKNSWYFDYGSESEMRLIMLRKKYGINEDIEECSIKVKRLVSNC